jgi:very-short-patch-repair endonuclease/restriction endonuclease S subunit
MVGEWKTVALGDVAGTRNGAGIKQDFFSLTGVPLARVSDFTDWSIDMSDCVRVEAGHAKNWESHRLNEGDVVVATVGSWPPNWSSVVGKAVRVPHSAAGAIQNQNTCCVFARPGITDQRFLFYLLRSEAFAHYAANAAAGSANQARLPVANLARFVFALPPLPEQSAIAHILGTLDDKIGLNRRMNETLEAMTRALFKSWFVDFDPVRAKANFPSPAGRGAGGEGPHCSSHAYPPTELRDFARALRNNQTDAEHLMWRILRDRRIAGAKFRRQHPVPPYVFDFYCHELKLAIELDGGQHGEPTGLDRDRQRDAALSERGITVLRFWNHEVLNETEAVLERIYQAVTERVSPSPQTPLPTGEGFCGLPKPLADLFPDSLEDSELGKIPKGWVIKSIGDLADVVGGTTPSTKEPAYWDGGTHAWATPKDLSGLSVPVLLDTERRITDAGLSQIGSGLLPKGTVLLSSRAPIGYLAVAEISVAINQGFIAMTPKTGTSNIFLLLWASVAHEEIVSRANGSTFLEISKANFRPIPVVTPSAGVMRAFEEQARHLYQRIVAAERDSRTLAGLRDTLLPKLVSGELRLKHRESFVEATV